MNFLAHCALGSGHRHHLVGGFLGDFVKGQVPAYLPLDLQTGIRLHRRIDAFSAVQGDIKSSVARLPATARRLAPVFIDLLADHFLARRFEYEHGQSLATFAPYAYGILANHEDYFPAPALRLSRFMRDNDLFSRYVDLDPVERAFRRIARRLGYDALVGECMTALRGSYKAFEYDFSRYYPALREHTAVWLSQASQQPSDKTG